MPDETAIKDTSDMQNQFPSGKKKKKKKGNFLLRFLLKTAVFIGAVVFVASFVLYFYRMDGNRMYPAMRDGDLGIFLRHTDVYSGDLVLYEDSEGNVRPGRIVAIGGQTVEFLSEGGYEVNGAANYDEVPYETYGVASSTVPNPITLAEDEYFILNDFRSDTLDSRETGPVAASQIKGKLLVLLRIRGF